MFRNRAFVGSQISDWNSSQKIIRYADRTGLTMQDFAESAKAIKSAYPNSQDGNYWLNINGVIKQIYCDMTNDGGGWMLYSSFSSDNPFSTSYPALNGNRILYPSFGTYGYSTASITNYSDGVNGSLGYTRKAEYFAHFNSGSPISYFYMNSYSGPSGVTQMRVRHGTGASWTGGSGDIEINGTNVYTDPQNLNGADVISVFNFNPTGTTPILTQIEYGIAGMSWIFIR